MNIYQFTPHKFVPFLLLPSFFSQRHLSPAICLSVSTPPPHPQTLTLCLRFKLSNQAASPLHWNTLTHTDTLIKKKHTHIHIREFNKNYNFYISS